MVTKNIALIFPGQGAQKVGMGQSFYQACPIGRAVFDQADIIVPGLTKVMFEGPEEKLTSTAFCQVAILTMSVAAFRSFASHKNYKNFNIKCTAGLSLGEYSALVAAGVMNFPDSLRLVQKRAAYMQEATLEHQGAMAAVIDFDALKLMEICRKTGAEIANFNAHNQIVITGHKAKVEAAIEAIKSAGGQKVIPLAVSGAFHSSLMSSAAQKFAVALKGASMVPTSIAVLSNVDAKPHTADTVHANLAKQITSSVQWVKCVEYIVSQGITDCVEMGPGRVLKGLIRRINPAVNVYNIETLSDLEALP